MNISAGGVAGNQLKAFVERIERLEEDKKNIAEDIKQVYAGAKAVGFDTRILRKVIQLRKMDPHERQEQETMLEVYLSAIETGQNVKFEVEGNQSPKKEPADKPAASAEADLPSTDDDPEAVSDQEPGETETTVLDEHPTDQPVGPSPSDVSGSPQPTGGEDRTDQPTPRDRNYSVGKGVGNPAFEDSSFDEVGDDEPPMMAAE